MAQNWSSKSAASAFAHGIFYFFIRCGGRGLAYFLLYFVVFYYTLMTKHGRRARFYVSRRFGRANALTKLWHAWRLNLTFGKILVDRAAMGISGMSGMIDKEPASCLLNELLEQGKGVLVLSGHMGCWQTAMSALDEVRAQKYVVYKRPTEDVDKLAHEHSGGSTSVRFIDPSGTFGGTTEIMSALQQNAVVCLTGDRLFGSKRNVISVPFLGGNIQVSGSSYRIAAALGTPVVILFFPCLGGGKFTAAVMDTFYIADKGADLQNYRSEATRFASAMEKFCSKYPYQFFNYYDMWE